MQFAFQQYIFIVTNDFSQIAFFNQKVVCFSVQHHREKGHKYSCTKVTKPSEMGKDQPMLVLEFV